MFTYKDIWLFRKYIQEVPLVTLKISNHYQAYHIPDGPRKGTVAPIVSTIRGMPIAGRKSFQSALPRYIFFSNTTRTIVLKAV